VNSTLAVRDLIRDSIINYVVVVLVLPSGLAGTGRRLQRDGPEVDSLGVVSQITAPMEARPSTEARSSRISLVTVVLPSGP
jgi:hypothetical protein